MSFLCHLRRRKGPALSSGPYDTLVLLTGKLNNDIYV